MPRFLRIPRRWKLSSFREKRNEDILGGCTLESVFLTACLSTVTFGRGRGPKEGAEEPYGTFEARGTKRVGAVFNCTMWRPRRRSIHEDPGSFVAATVRSLPAMVGRLFDFRRRHARRADASGKCQLLLPRHHDDDARSQVLDPQAFDLTSFDTSLLIHPRF